MNYTEWPQVRVAHVAAAGPLLPALPFRGRCSAPAISRAAPAFVP